MQDAKNAQSAAARFDRTLMMLAIVPFRFRSSQQPSAATNNRLQGADQEAIRSAGDCPDAW